MPYNARRQSGVICWSQFSSCFLSEATVPVVLGLMPAPGWPRRRAAPGVGVFVRGERGGGASGSFASKCSVGVMSSTCACRCAGRA